MLEFLIPAVSFGFTAGVIPGPLQVYLLNVTLRQGWRGGRWLTFAPLISDPPIIVLMVFILGQLPPEVLRAIQVIGGLFIWWIAWGSYQQLRAEASASADDAPLAHETPRQIMAKGWAMNTFNPGPFVFWSTVTGPLFVQAIQQGGAGWGLAFLLGFYGTFVLMLVAQVALYHRLGQTSMRTIRVILWVAVVGLFLLGLRLIIG